jgi:hypothetical protein
VDSLGAVAIVQPLPEREKVVPLVSALSLATHHDWYSFIVLVQVLIP